MPILANAKKALRNSQRKAEVNNAIRSKVKTFSDKVRKEPTAENLATAYSAIDRAAKNHVLHVNKAARLKSQLSNLVKAN